MKSRSQSRKFYEQYYLEGTGDNHSAIHGSGKALDEVMSRVLALCLKNLENLEKNMMMRDLNCGEMLKNQLSFV